MRTALVSLSLSPRILGGSHGLLRADRYRLYRMSRAPFVKITCSTSKSNFQSNRGEIFLLIYVFMIMEAHFIRRSLFRKGRIVCSPSTFRLPCFETDPRFLITLIVLAARPSLACVTPRRSQRPAKGTDYRSPARRPTTEKRARITRITRICM